MYVCNVKIEDAIQQKKFKNLQQKAIINLMYTNNWLIDQQNQLFSEFDITPQQFNVLRILKGKSPESTCPSAIKAVMIDKNPDLTRLCDRLLEKGVIEREFNPLNRRQVNIRINQKGIDLLRKIQPRMEQHAKTIKLSNKDAKMLSEILDRLRS